MLVRELEKKNQKWRLVLAAYASTCREQSGQEIERMVTTKAEFDREFKKRLNDGWVETEASLSRRAFLSGTEEDGKLWIIEVEGDLQTVQYGKIRRHGYSISSGQTKTNYFDSADKALLEFHKQIAKKLSDGYKEYHPRKTEYSNPPADLKVKAPRKRKVTPATRASSRMTTTKAVGANANQREFTFDDGKSSKFWKIELDGKQHTVQFGRLGTKGQAKTKEFDSDEKAKASFETLIAEKLKKGYAEAQATTTSTKQAKPKNAKAGKTSEPATAAPEQEPVQIVTKVTHFVDLELWDWFWAMWRDPDPLPQPEPKPFDKDACLESIRGARSQKAFEGISPQDPSALSGAEAEFWLHALQIRKKYNTPRTLAEALAKKDFTGDKSLDDFSRRQQKHRPWRMDLVLRIIGPDDFAKLLLVYGGDRWAQGNGLQTFQRWVVPYLSRPDREKLRKVITPEANKAQLPKNTHDGFHVSIYLAAALGCDKIIDSVLSAQSANPYLQQIIWGLGSAERVEQEVDRIQSESDIWWPMFQSRAWLAHTETRRLDILRDGVLSVSKGWGGQAEKVADLALVKDPAAAPYLLEIRAAGKSAELATAWLDEQVGNAITGLVPVAIEKRGQLADAAKAYLREKQRLGFGDIIEKALKSVAKEDAQRLRATALNVPELGPPLDAKTTPAKLEPLLAEAAELVPLKGSEWLDARKLPPVVVGKGHLAPEQVDALVLALQHSEFESPLPLVKQIGEFADRGTLAEFAWTLFETWLAQDAPTKHKWAMRALGHLGNDGTALKLTPLVRAWPGESQHPRAVLGLECLRAIGSDTALMQLSGIAQKVKFKALQRKAMDCVEQIAAEKGMSRDELEDRVVPDCGLDERGSCTFDFGERKFFFALDGDNKPVVRDDDRKLKKDLPKPAAKDDAKKAAQAVADWKQLKKQIREVVKVQNARLEQALITGRRWRVADFETLLVRHPLMTNLVQRLLWAGFDKQGKRMQLFRATEERDYADSQDEPVDLSRCADVGLVHPLHLTDAERSTWGEVLADYEIVAPFAQLSRPMNQLDSAARKKDSFAHFEGLKLPALKLLGLLDRGGWTRGMPQDNGVFREHYKHFYAADLTAIVHYEYGIGINYYGEEEVQEIEGCFFVPGIYTPRGWPRHKTKVKLDKVDPVVVSEVMTDLIEMENKAV